MKESAVVNECKCGCGSETGTYKATNRSLGIVKGQPKQFIPGHGNKLHRADQRPFAERHEVDAEGCWLWTGTIDKGGYGHYRQDDKSTCAHRVAYEMATGEKLPKGIHLDHTCHNADCKKGRECKHRRCVNPDHLQVTTPAENVRKGALPKISFEIAEEIRLRLNQGESPASLMEFYEVSSTTIHSIRTFKTWKQALTLEEVA